MHVYRLFVNVNGHLEMLYAVDTLSNNCPPKLLIQYSFSVTCSLIIVFTSTCILAEQCFHTCNVRVLLMGELVGRWTDHEEGKRRRWGGP